MPTTIERHPSITNSLSGTDHEWTALRLQIVATQTRRGNSCGGRRGLEVRLLRRRRGPTRRLCRTWFGLEQAPPLKQAEGFSTCDTSFRPRPGLIEWAAPITLRKETDMANKEPSSRSYSGDAEG